VAATTDAARFTTGVVVLVGVPAEVEACPEASASVSASVSAARIDEKVMRECAAVVYIALRSSMLFCCF
jgi:hypothetical protein